MGNALGFHVLSSSCCVRSSRTQWLQEYLSPRQPLGTSLMAVFRGASGLDRRAGVKYVFFDFDQTLSRVHIFKQLAGWEKSSRQPFARTERGQMYRVGELDTKCTWRYDEATGCIVQDDVSAAASTWTCAALGGKARVEELRQLLRELQGSGAKLAVITKGYVGVVQYVLRAEDLLGCFMMIFGMVGNSYSPLSEYDLVERDPMFGEGTKANQLTSSKAHLISTLMSQDGVRFREAILVEDDIHEIESVKNVCRSVFVSQRTGIGSQEFREIREIAFAASAPEGPESQ